MSKFVLTLIRGTSNHVADPDRRSSGRDRGGAGRSGIALLCVAFFLLPQPKPRYKPGEEPNEAEKLSE